MPGPQLPSMAAVSYTHLKQQLAHKPGKQRHANHGQGAHGKADARNFMAVGGSRQILELPAAL